MPALTIRHGVPIAKIGTWHASTGVWTCTAEQLRSAVQAQHDPAFRKPVLKIGHDDPRFDGEPAVGRLEKLRLSADGQTLLADLAGVPAWLDDVMASAFPSRSIEALLDVSTDTGTHYAMVVTGLALLGVTAPAIESLGDIAELYAASTDVQHWLAASSIAASALPPGASALPSEAATIVKPRQLGQVVRASASIDELVGEFENWANEQPLLGDEAWCRDIYTDYLVAVVWVGGESRYYRCTWTESDGTFIFGTPERVRPTYEPMPGSGPTDGTGSDTPEISASKSHDHELPIFPVRYDRGRVVDIDIPREIDLPISPALAERLGVPIDADDDTVLEAVSRIEREATITAPASTQQAPVVPTETAERPSGETPDIEAMVAAAVASHTAPILASLTATTTELAQIKASREADTKSRIIGDAVRAGKIRPADRTTYEAQYDLSPVVVTNLLAATAAGSAVPISAAGRPGTDDEGSEGLEAEWAGFAAALKINTEA